MWLDVSTRVEIGRDALRVQLFANVWPRASADR
jgi:hypothetical protein